MHVSPTETASTELESHTTGARFLALDGLRGFAALAVVLHHFASVYRIKPRWYLAPFTAGTAAVLLFFLLSGFVLSVPFWQTGTNGSYTRYLTRRFFRIYVPYFAALVLAIAAALRYTDTHHPFHWYYRTWQTPVTPWLIGHHLLVLGSTELNPAFWSLRFEVQLSVLFPALLLLLRVISARTAAVAFTILFTLASFAIDNAARDPHLILELLKYSGLFAGGALLARALPRFRTHWDRLVAPARYASVVLALTLFFGYPDHILDRHHVAMPSDLLPSLGAALLLVLALFSASVGRFLQSRIPLYLGRISYSVYLLHGTILFTLLSTLGHRLTPLALGAIYLTMTLGLAHLFCILVEEPALRMGKALAARSGELSFRTLWQPRPRTTTAR